MADLLPPEFFSLADRFIEVANANVKTHGLPVVSAAFTFAAARFNGHAAVAMHPEAGPARDAIIKVLVDQYRDMLVGNVDEAVKSKTS